MKITTVILDIGNVLVGYDWRKFFNTVTHDAKKDERLYKAFFRSGVWPELDRGVWPEKDILKGFVAADPELREEILTCFHHIGDAMWQFPFAKDWILELKNKGLRVLFLSNWSYHLLAQNPGLVDFVSMMDGGIFSCDVQLIKPNHDIYEELIRRYDLVPEESVFLDDHENNVIAARECGLWGIVVKNHEQAVSDLENMTEGRGNCHVFSDGIVQ